MNIFAIKIHSIEVLPEKGKFFYEGKHDVMKCFDFEGSCIFVPPVS